MSLRYKALIAVVLLVGMLTGGMAWRAGQLYEQSERKRIRHDLRRDARWLNRAIQLQADTERSRLAGEARSAEFVELLSRVKHFGQALNHYVRMWRATTGAEIALAAMEKFIAKERNAKVIDKWDELWLIGLAASPELPRDDYRAAATDPGIREFLERFFAEAIASEDKDPERSRALVLPAAGSVYLVVGFLLYESLATSAAADVVGVGAVLIRLDEAWLTQHLSLPGAEVDQGQASGPGENPIYKIIFSGETSAATTFSDRDGSRRVFEHALDAGSAEFEIELDPDGVSQTFLGFRTPIGLTDATSQSRPGLVAFKNLDRELEPLVALRRDVGLAGAMLSVLGSIVAWVLAYSVIRKLRRIEAATVKVREGQFDTRVEISGRDELASLGKAFNAMTAGLKALGLYTHDSVARRVLDNPELAATTSRRETGTILFSDIKGFTPIAEKLSPEELTAQLNEYFTAIGRHVREQQGYVDKFIGDSLMAFWGPPFVKDDQFANRAVRAALRAHEACAELRVGWARSGKPLFFQRIGLATGEVVVGNIGSKTKKNFTVIGDSVNLASRLEGANKLYGTDILLDGVTAARVGDEFLLREVDRVRVVGKREPVTVFEPLGIAAEVSESLRALAATYAGALALYREARFKEAAETLEGALRSNPEDGATNWLNRRCRELQQSTPDDWEPVTNATTK